MKRILALLVILTLLTACHQEQKPTDIIDRETYTQFLVEAHLLESYYATITSYRYDSLSTEIAASYNELFHQFHITREDYQRTTQYYAEHNDELIEIYQEVGSRIAQKTPRTPGQ